MAPSWDVHDLGNRAGGGCNPRSVGLTPRSPPKRRSAHQCFEQRKILCLIRIDLPIRDDHGARRVEEDLTMLTRDIRGIDIFGGRRHLKPLLDLLALVVVELELPHQLAHKGPLLVLNLEIRPGERADEPHQPKPILTIQSVHGPTLRGDTAGGKGSFGGRDANEATCGARSDVLLQDEEEDPQAQEQRHPHAQEKAKEKHTVAFSEGHHCLVEVRRLFRCKWKLLDLLALHLFHVTRAWAGAPPPTRGRIRAGHRVGFPRSAFRPREKVPMTTKVTMPQLGESVVEGTVGRWLVKEGDRVEKDQPIVEILTDKADTEVPSPVAGVVTQIHAEVDQIVEVGGVLCEVDEAASAAAQGSSSATVSAAQDAPATAPDAHASPSVRKLARERDVNLDELRGTGEGGRITREDVLAAANRAEAARPHPASPPPPPGAPHAESGPTAAPTGAFRMPPYTPSPGDEVVPFTRRRRIIADHMVFSKRVAPDVVTFAECDLYRTAKLRDAHKGAYKKEGLNLTFMAFVAHATARALREFPELNARVLDDAYVKLKHLNLGIAVDTPEGLVVPVIKDADELSIRGLAKAIIDLAERARNSKLTPDDLANKTFTISNPGRRGNLVGGAIISQPNVGILRLGTIKKRPVVIERDGEDILAIHPVMYMALTYDHRVVDGVHANGFLYRISEILEEGDFEV